MTKNTRPKPKERHRGATATAARVREKATAYHEAGHAVACYCLGVKVKSATVVRDKDQGTHGHVRHENMFLGLDPEIDQSMGLKSPDQKLRSSIVSAVRAHA
jgi:hypothetical protein